jgi:NAD(P)-dependent dehydrogenase (short-subunit alcohol dehydrogenase family)
MNAPLSHPPAAAPSVDDIRRCTQILEAVISDRALLALVPLEERQAFLTAAGRVSRPKTHEERRLVKAFRREGRRRKRMLDRGVVANAEIRAARQASVFVAPAPVLPESKPELQRELLRSKNCYTCKKPYTKLHFFYDSMCPECAEFNYSKRFQSAPLDGRVAVITGARVKIGFQAALKMLRAGASVIVTTRFPHDAAQRYSREADFAEWRDRLQIHGLDLRHAPSVEIFTRFLNRTCTRLDILINNAAQTVRRPPGYYAHLLESEMQPFEQLPEPMRALLAQHEACKSALSLPHASKGSRGGEFLPSFPSGGETALGLTASAKLSQIPYAYDEDAQRLDVFPTGKMDADLQQIDLRTQNSWRLTLSEVATPEMLEVHLVNAVAPFILCGKLKPLMLRERTNEKHIVNVSAMEGIFSRGTKTDKHPHTNMAKAALNMMTLTSARDYARDGIFMNAVDTGWVTDEDPAIHAERKREELDFQPPLDIVDGAARICDPFFSGLLSGTHVWGKFLKDYKASNW